MRPFVKYLPVAAAVVGIVIIGIALGLFGVRKSGGTVDSRPEPDKPVSMPPAPPVAAGANSNSPAMPIGRTPPRTNVVQVPSAHPATNLLADWEEKLETILGSEGEEREKVKQLLGLFPRVSAEGQVEVAQHLSNLVEDHDYESLKKLLLDPKMPEDVLDVLVADILNRPNGIKLPTLLEVARTPDHPKAEEAKDLLELYLEEDYGPDWPKWQASMDQWLKDNPD